MVEFQTGDEFRKTGSPIHGDAPLDSLYGVGDVMKERLVDAGYLSVSDIVTAEPEELANVEGITPNKAEDLIVAAHTELSYWPDK